VKKKALSLLIRTGGNFNFLVPWGWLPDLTSKVTVYCPGKRDFKSPSIIKAIFLLMENDIVT
jgi:hypothetical protein